MGRVIQKYTMHFDRSGVWEGTFEESNDINPGDYILTHHRCRFCNAPILKRVTDKVTAYSIKLGDGPETQIYDYHVEGGGTYKSNLVLVSTYDSLVRQCDMSEFN